MKNKLIKKVINGVYCEYYTFNNVLNGVFREYHSNKILKNEKNYVNNILHGECKYFNKNGEYSYSLWYFEGNLVKKAQFKNLMFLENCEKLEIE